VADIKRYGDEGHLVPGDYYLIRESRGSLGTGERAVHIFIDGLGKTEQVAVARPDTFTPEEIAQLPTRHEAVAFHLVRAFDRGEANRKAWLREVEKEPKPEPKPPPPDKPTQRFFSDEGVALDLSDW
jgi:hypothetical protein